MRRDRLERIAMAERDRRAGRIDVAVASLGEATEWPARVVLALARLSDFEANETRRILEEGLDVWADEVGLDSLDSNEELDEMVNESGFEAFVPPAPIPSESESDLDRPINNDELERAFAEAETQTDEMHDVNHVAERVLMSESAGLASLSGDDLVSSHEPAAVNEASVQDVFGMDAAVVPDAISASPPETERDSSRLAAPEVENEDRASRSSRDKVLATLGRWLENIEAGSVGRAR
jgi:hypothetical protein